MPCARREDVRDVYPRKRAPAHAVEAHVEVQHRRHRLARRGRRRGIRGWRVGLEQSADDEEEDAHAHRRDEERHLASQRVYEEEHEKCRRNDLDDAVDARREQRIRRACVPDLPQTY